MIKAPPMTKASDGSQLPARSKKLMTLAGFDMPEMTMPRPKISPMAKVESSRMGYAPITWRIT
jgi:hypothetical protein